MAKKESEPVELEREPRPRRRLRWWMIVLIVILVPILALAIWVLTLRGAFEAPEAEATLPPEAVAEGGVFYETNFEDPAQFTDWEIFDDGRISAAIENGQLVVSIITVDDQGAWSGLTTAAFTDFVLDVDAVKLAGPDDNGIVVIFRRVDDQNYNRFEITSDGFYALSTLRGGEYAVISNYGPSPAILTGDAVNHIRIRGIGDQFSFEVNDTPLQLCVSPDSNVQPLWDVTAAEPTCLGGEVVDAWQNADLMEGRIGLGAQAFTGFDMDTGSSTMAEATIAFDNLVIAAPE